MFLIHIRAIILPTSTHHACVDTGKMYPRRRPCLCAYHAIASAYLCDAETGRKTAVGVWRGKQAEITLCGITPLFNRRCPKGRESPYAGRDATGGKTVRLWWRHFLPLPRSALEGRKRLVERFLYDNAHLVISAKRDFRSYGINFFVFFLHMLSCVI